MKFSIRFGLILSLMLVWVMPGMAWSAAGDPDLSFGTGGATESAFGPNTLEQARAVAIQPNGKIVVAGNTFDSSGTTLSDIALVRYNTDGTLDTSFGTGGLVALDFGNNITEFGNAIALQGDGKIVVAGEAVDSMANTNDCAVARYNPDGTFDTSFGAGGHVILDMGVGPSGFNYPDHCQAVAVQTDGKIVVAGTTDTPINLSDVAVARLNADGTLDGTFGLTGVVLSNLQPFSFDFGNAVAIQPDGKIIVAGYSNIFGPTRDDIAILRYNPDGSVDTGFGINGLVLADFGNMSNYGNAVAIQPDGKIAVAGYSVDLINFDKEFTVARFNANGSVDSTFGSGGGVITEFDAVNNTPDEGRSIALQSDGKIVVAGTIGGFPKFAMARYLNDGSLDFTFGVNGLVTITFTYKDYIGTSVAIQSDGGIVLAGHTSDRFNSYNTDIAIARFLGDTVPAAPSIVTPANNVFTNSTARPTISGTADAGVSVNVKDGATSLGLVTATGGNWSLAGGGANLTEGVHSFTATATNAAGKTGPASIAVIYTVDITVPVVTAPANISVVATQAGGMPATDTAIVAFLNGAAASDSVDGAITPANDAPAVFPIGATLVTFSATDAAGNTATATATVTVTTPLTPLISLGLNGAAFNTNSTMTVTASTVQSAPVANADVYVALQLPDGTLLVMQPDGSFSTTLTALVSNIPVPDFSGPIFNYTFTGAEPVGNYTWFAALTTPGSLNIIGTMAVQPFSFGP